jgi:hypothetical protein
MSKWLQNKTLRSLLFIQHSGDYSSIAKVLILPGAVAGSERQVAITTQITKLYT